MEWILVWLTVDQSRIDSTDEVKLGAEIVFNTLPYFQPHFILGNHLFDASIFIHTMGPRIISNQIATKASIFFIMSSGTYGFSATHHKIRGS